MGLKLEVETVGEDDQEQRKSRRRSWALRMQTELKIRKHDLSDIDEAFSVDEIKSAVFELNPDKALGPDGYTALFVQHCWDTITLDFVAAVRAVQNLNTNQFHRLNVATMVLLAKKPDASSPREFRPISLIGILAKIMMKIMAVRLRPKMAESVKPCQNAFIKGRMIHDSFTYVRCLARAFRQAKTPALMIKLDIEKEFDSVSWDFLLELMEKLGFGQR
ncbi:hypothetical protein ACQ4PT_040839 [Festuca glaucescens]